MIAEILLTPEEQHGFQLALAYMLVALCASLGVLAIINWSVVVWREARK